MVDISVETEKSSTSFIHTERDSNPPLPSRVQLERTRGGETEEALDNSPGHRRSSSVPAERAQVLLGLNLKLAGQFIAQGLL